MAFGQAAGPPASALEIAELAELLRQAGYDSFREARHPFDLNQRQAGGKFTRDEAAELIERLTAAADVASGRDGPPGSPAAPEPADAPKSTKPRAARPTKAAGPTSGLRRPGDEPVPDGPSLAPVPDEVLADELVRRGWMCIPPS